MFQHAPTTNSRLIHTLQALLALDSTVPHQRFVGQLGKLIDLSGSITLADFLADLRHVQGQQNSSGSSNSGDKQGFMQTRGEMVSFIAQSFNTESLQLAFRLPIASDASFSNDDLGLTSYQRFYALHQSEMDGRIIKLLAQIRKHLSTCSTSLAQLAVLDAKLNDILANYSRKLFAAIPTMLAKRFRHLCTEQYALAPETHEIRLHTFLHEMQAVLLAELEVRLQPALGLIEALTIEQEKQST